MNAKLEQKERTHETILESAARLLRSRGISGARVADVMKGAGLTVGGFYAHFASKEVLVDDALRLTGQRMRERLFARLDEKDESVRAEVVLKRYLSVAHRDEVGEGCPFPAVMGEVGTSAPEHRAVVAEQLESYSAELRSILPADGEISRKHVSLALIALMYGGLSMARAVRGTDLSDEIIKACRSVGRIVLRDSKNDETRKS